MQQVRENNDIRANEGHKSERKRTPIRNRHRVKKNVSDKIGKTYEIFNVASNYLAPVYATDNGRKTARQTGLKN